METREKYCRGAQFLYYTLSAGERRQEVDLFSSNVSELAHSKSTASDTPRCGSFVLGVTLHKVYSSDPVSISLIAHF